MRPTNRSIFTYEDKLPIQHSLRHSSTLESISLCRIVQRVIDHHDRSIYDNKNRHNYKDTNVIKSYTNNDAFILCKIEERKYQIRPQYYKRLNVSYLSFRKTIPSIWSLG
jgi:hypothetical protein